MGAGDRLRSRLLGGEALVGTFLKLPATEAVELIATVGFDLAVIDLEHSQLDEAAARRLVRHAYALDYPVLVRVPAVDRGLINRLLEAGAAGIQLSSLRSVAQRRALQAASRYPPDGRRSISLAHAPADYGAGDLPSYLRDQRIRPPLLVGQIETADEDDPLDQVIAGLDVAFIGTADLSVDMGFPGTLTEDPVQKRLRHIAGATEAAGATLGGWAPSPEQATALVELGARYVLVGSDLQMLRGGLADLPARTREAFG